MTIYKTHYKDLFNGLDLDEVIAELEESGPQHECVEARAMALQEARAISKSKQIRIKIQKERIWGKYDSETPDPADIYVYFDGGRWCNISPEVTGSYPCGLFETIQHLIVGMAWQEGEFSLTNSISVKTNSPNFRDIETVYTKDLGWLFTEDEIFQMELDAALDLSELAAK